MKRLTQKILGAMRNPKKVIRLVAKQFYILLKFGPLEYSRYFKRAFGKHMFIHNFPNGIKTSLDLQKANNWHLLNKKPLVVVLIGAPKNSDIAIWMQNVQKKLQCHFLVGDKAKKYLVDLDKNIYKITECLSTKEVNMYDIWQEVQQHYRGNDIILIDVEEDLIGASDIMRLQHAAYSYDDDNEIGFVAPAYIDRSHKNNVVAGFEYNKKDSLWLPSTTTKKDYGQVYIPRYNLIALSHGLYIKHSVIQSLSVSRQDVRELKTLNDQVGFYIFSGWKQNIKTLSFSSISVSIKKLQTPTVQSYHKLWLEVRTVLNQKGDTKVIYVLNATSMSGGIRVIFEHADSLIRRGFDVEIWSLQGQPTWTSVDVVIRKFHSYSDLMLALRNEDAIKVATWWETAQIVWLSSVNHGIPVNFVQEFETWFYPNDNLAQAAVVSSYRKEFTYMTTADYQHEELRQIGIDAQIIPVGYEKKYYYENKKISRESDAVLAVGRSFFQKNFAMTLRAWKKLAEKRPRLFLFGFEPNIIKDDKVTYFNQPSNEEVNQLYNRATCFVQTSIHEGFSLPIIEAMAAGCPVITTDSHGNRGFCFDGKNCLLVGQDDSDALALAIERLLHDTALQETLRQEGLVTARQYEWSNVIDRLAEFYKKA